MTDPDLRGGHFYDEDSLRFWRGLRNGLVLTGLAGIVVAATVLLVVLSAGPARTPARSDRPGPSGSGSSGSPSGSSSAR